MPWQNGTFYLTEEEMNNDSTTKNNEQKQNEPANFDGDYEEPRANEIQAGVGIPGGVSEQEIARDYKEDAIFRRIKNSPEIISIMQAVIDDVIGSGIKKWEYVGRESNAENPGKRSRQDAKEFWRDNKEIIADSMLDAMAVGDGYLYKMQPDEEEAKSMIREQIVKNYTFNNSEYEEAAAQLVTSKSDHFGLGNTEELRLVAASTVEHDIDEFGNIERYVQDIGADEYDLEPSKVIHHSYLNLNGKTYGFTPVAALFAELDMLANAKDYNGVRFNNAAVPNKLIKMPEDGPDSQNFQMVKETLKEYRRLENKHRDLVMTGEIEVEDLNDAAEMEFRQLAEYVTRVIIMAWGVPPSRVGGVLDGGGGATTGAMAQAGYNKRIKRMQDKYETILNNEIFEPMFNIRIEFENPDTKAEIREAERDLRKTEVVKQQMALGLMNREEAMRYLGKSDDQVADMDEEEARQAAREMGSSQEDMGQDSSTANEPAENEVNQGMSPDDQTNL